MNKVFSSVKLDFLTTKPYLTFKNLGIFAAVMLFLTYQSGNAAAGIGVGLIIGTLCLSYPFSIGEKNNMDALYVTLAINKHTVVLARYIYTLIFDVCATVFATIAAFAFSIAGVTMSGGASDTFSAFMGLSAIFLVIQAIQLPIYFKLGYTKAKLVSIFPFVIIMAAGAAFLSTGLRASNKLTDALAGLLNKIGGSTGAIYLISVLALAVIIYLSYGLSLAFYSKREF